MPRSSSLLNPVVDHPLLVEIRSQLALEATSRELAPEANLRSEGEPLCLGGLTETAKALVIASLAHRGKRQIIVLTSDNEAADRLRSVTATFLRWLKPDTTPDAVAILPAYDCSPYESRSPHPEIAERRAVTLWGIARASVQVLIAPVAAALGRFRDRAFYGSLALELKVGDELPLEDLVSHLSAVGYEHAEPVSTVGQYSLRGGILDVCPPSGSPARMEFFGDRLESLRAFNMDTQRSEKPLAQTLIPPLSEHQRSPGFFARLLERLKERSGDTSGREPDWAPMYTGAFPGWEFYATLVQPTPKTLSSLFERPCLVWDEPGERIRQIRSWQESLAAQYDEIRDAVPARVRPDEVFLTEEEFARSHQDSPSLWLRELPFGGPQLEGGSADSGSNAPPGALPVPKVVKEFVITSQPAPKHHGALKRIIEEIRSRYERGEQLILVLPAEGKLARMSEILAEYQISYTAGERAETPASPDSPVAAIKKPVALVRGEMDEGVIFPDLALSIFADADLFGAAPRAGRSERPLAASFLSDLNDLKVGDYVVHLDHGIGLYAGLKQIEHDGRLRDFMLLTYQDDAKLYVPLERLDLVEKYRRGGEGAKPVLDRLGGATWARTKTRVKRALRDMAEELLRLYAERKMKGGYAFSPDTPWQKEFEQAFEFELTPDQKTALEEIRHDLESHEPMDRLLVGDVGYGKTELAMRAAFKVVQDAKQVAVLAPTTVLAFQHYNTFRQRMAAFPIRIEMLSRFRSAAEQKEVLADTEAGRVDIVIGTHRMLSKDVRFRDLGLLVVDEEQRFGVGAKEKLKKLKSQVDLLTLTATPIPRTLHMSLGGLRDLSVIETPPLGRLAIQTVVAPFSDALVQSAILQEMNRQGQAFFVHNRVESIFGMAALVQRLVPTARIGVAHGQMGEKELEKVMLKFMEGGYDVLAATALIENGLDIPRANTILVNHADRFGLADLYQLRGRVGRSDRRAYAHFLVPSEDSLTPTARRRLAALKEFSELGSGLRLAALDLELRGAGNLLGAEQSGHLNAVGIDLYLEMLEETVAELRGAAPKPEVRASLNLGLDIKIPATYIADERQRLLMYKRISSLATAEERAGIESELADRYGPVPTPVVNLLNYAQLKTTAEAMLVQSVERKAEDVFVHFHERAPVNSEKLKRFLRQRREATFRPGGTLRFRLAVPESQIPAGIEYALRELGA